jgi:hypothetical protein
MSRCCYPHAEPSLSTVLNEPIIRLLMASDHVSERDLLQGAEIVRTRARRGAMEGAGAPPSGVAP